MRKCILLCFTAFFILILGAPLTSHGQWSEQQKLIADDTVSDDDFGYEVSIYGDYAIIGAREVDIDGVQDQGAAYIFKRIDSTWTQQAKLIQGDYGPAQKRFAYSDVSISGDYAIVGAENDGANGDYAGAAYIFYRNQDGADSWGQQAKLLASDGATRDYFGKAVSISGDYVIVGAYGDDESDSSTNTGAAYIFYRNQGGTNNWGEVKKIVSDDLSVSDAFGFSVSISGDFAIVGAFANDSSGVTSGAAYIFYRNQGGADNWGQVTQILASDGDLNHQFGEFVAISGDDAIVGAKYADGVVADSGAAYIFNRNQGGSNNWGEVKKIYASDGTASEWFGSSVSISGNYAVVGAYRDADAGSYSGAVYSFYRDQGGTDNWGEYGKLTASDANASDYFGKSVSISNNYFLTGAYGNDDNGSSSGSAYIFHKPQDNAAPTADAGSNQTDVLDRAIINISGVCNDDDANDNLTGSWSVSGGTCGNLNSTQQGTASSRPRTINGSCTAGNIDSDTTLTFTLTCSDGTINVDNSVNVEVNAAPTATPQSIGTDEDTPVEITLEGTDPSDSIDSYIIIDSPSHGTLSGIAPDITYTPDSNFNGTDSFTFIVNDGLQDSESTATIDIAVDSENDLPIITLSKADRSQSLSNSEEDNISFTGSVTDHDNDTVTLQWTQISGPGTLYFTPENEIDFENYTYSKGKYYLQLRANDGTGISSSDTVEVNIVNSLPEIVSLQIDGATLVGNNYVFDSFNNEVAISVDTIMVGQNWTRKRA